MSKKTKTIFVIIIGLLLVLNAATWVFYFSGRDSDDGGAANVSEEPAADSGESRTDKNSKAESSDPGDPLIAVVDYDTEDAERVGKRLTEAGLENERVGAIEDLDVDKYDAIVIPGGHSVDPEMYGAERQPETTDTDITKDKFQFAAVQMYVDAGKPVLGICRGSQLVNNVLGGTTIQHMSDGWHKKNRYVRIAEGTWLYDMFGKEALVYHYHHQCVDELGEGLYATQWDAESGCIEAYEHKTLPVYGLQWHPDASEMDGTGTEVFEAFGEIVKENMKG